MTYFRHVSPQWYFLQGVESVDGQIMFVQANSQCLTAADASNGSISDWGDLGLERTDAATSNITSMTAWRTRPAMHHTFSNHTAWNRLGFHDMWQLGYHNPTWIQRIVLPYWALAVPLALWPAGTIAGVTVRRQRRMLAQRRQRQGRCTGCGYDLRATPQRCPECGTAVPGHSDTTTAESSVEMALSFTVA
jgi:hypothetical protein